MKHRCQKWIKHHDQVLRCQEQEGHGCVHYSGEVWWPNKRPVVTFNPFVLGIVVTAIILGAIAWWRL